MKIINSYGYSRRDFRADMKCESCGNIEKNVSCYDDNYFHRQVIPNMECKKCGKKSLEITSGARFDDCVVI
jgi:Zn finger protein HypA/HybF involved in hydrogenase expression